MYSILLLGSEVVRMYKMIGSMQFDCPKSAALSLAFVLGLIADSGLLVPQKEYFAELRNVMAHHIYYNMTIHGKTLTLNQAFELIDHATEVVKQQRDVRRAQKEADMTLSLWPQFQV